jgi:hypothetical protein
LIKNTKLRKTIEPNFKKKNQVSNDEKKSIIQNNSKEEIEIKRMRIKFEKYK